MMNNTGDIRTRFAPSPTGPMHIGGVRTALFNYLYARQRGGSFILRVEDTDVERSKTEWEHMLIRSLNWLGFDWEEGPEIVQGQESMFDSNNYSIRNKGDFGPYRQSERKNIYRNYLQKMIDEGTAYYCFCTKEEVEAQKNYLMSIGESPVYKGNCRGVSKEKVSENLAQGKKSVIRFRTPERQKIVFDDMIKGRIEFDSAILGDFVIAKDLENPLYNFTCAIDDHEMGITHVIRGEDHVSNTPKQILLLNALGFEKPSYAHMPLILGEGKKKLSKRDAETSLDEYRKEGYLPETIINFVAFLGWNPGTDKEIYSMKELMEDFSVEKIQKSGAVFNADKLDWLNGLYIRKKGISELAEACVPYLIESGLIKRETADCCATVETGEIVPMMQIERAVKLYQERMKKLSEISDFIDFVFKKEVNYDKELLRWKGMTDEEIMSSLVLSLELVSSIEDFNEQVVQEEFFKAAEGMSNKGNLLWPFRVALTGKQSSAGPFEVAQLLGKEKCLKRLESAMKKLKYS
ncbi:glutamate--tRNA ligase [Minisyncoccus archaeiphilus]|uniref:glutamate--tRNA ligase n=1 Tax=Minisyncoccus archaeiphilus TaxID=3238481 RepID=UPI00399CB416